MTCPHCHADAVLLLAKGQRSCGTCGHVWSAANRRRAKRRRKAAS